MERTQRYRDVTVTAARWLAETNSVEILFGRFCELLEASLGQLVACLAFSQKEQLRIEFAYEASVARHLEGAVVAQSAPAYQVLESQKTRVVRGDERRAVELPSQSEALYTAYIPLRIGTAVSGVFWVSRVSGNEFTCDELNLIEAVTGYLGAAVRENRTELATLELEELAGTDSLTGTANRRAFDQRLENECASMAQVALLIFDVDHFKAYNDTYGHVTGDEALHRIAQRAAKQFSRTADFFARYGGEEFVAVLPRTNMDGAARVAQKVRAAIYEMAIPHAGSPDGVLTVSFVVTSIQPVPGREGAALVGLADRALYAAKNA